MTPRDQDQNVMWESLSEAGLVEIPIAEFPDRIRHVKQTVMTRLSQLLERETDWRERESAAYSLGTLKKLEAKLVNASRSDE